MSIIYNEPHTLRVDETEEATTETMEKPKLLSELRKHPSMFGYAFFYTWFIIELLGISSQLHLYASGWMLPATMSMPFLGLVVASCVLKAKPDLSNLDSTIKRAAVATCCSLPGIYFFVCGMAPQSSFAALHAFFGLVAGIAAPSLFVIWQQTSAKLPLSNFTLTEGFTTVLGGLIGGLALLFLPPISWGLLGALFMIASVNMLRRALSDVGTRAAQAPRKREVQRISEHLDKRIRVLFFVFCAIFGFAWSLLIFSNTAAAWIALIVGAVVVALFISTRLAASDVSDRFVVILSRVCLAGLSCALFCCFLGIKSLFAAALGLAVVLWTVFWTVDNSLMLQQAQLFGFDVARHGATSKIVNQTGFLFGWIAGLTTFMLPQVNTHVVASACLGICILLVLLGAWLIPLGTYESPTKIIEQREMVRSAKETRTSATDESIEAKIARTSKHFQLTAREDEILFWLVRGHVAKSISTQLSISESTAKTHMNNIYKKMNIHTQQELIDLVENM